jgi:cell division protein FtsN
MSHDYGKAKNKKPTKKNTKNSKQPLPAWVLFGSGVVFTLFAQLLFHFATSDTQVNTTPEKAAITKQEDAPKKPTINFYNQLKKMEVKVPANQEEVKAIVPVTGETKEITTDSNIAEKPAPYNYVLQAGSYRSTADADEQRASLSMLGLKSSIEVKANSDGTNYYRVMVGPFTSASELDKARTTLKNNNTPSITVKR